MQSDTPKAVMPVGGEPMLNFILRTLRRAGLGCICVVVSENLIPHLATLELEDATVCIQREQLGTGHALASACVAFADVEPPCIGDQVLYRGSKITCEHLLVCPADIPALKPETISAFLHASLPNKSALHVIGVMPRNPRGYGRLVMRDKKLQKIVEERDADDATRAIARCNSGVMLISTAACSRLLSGLKRNNQQQEFYLTDICAQTEASVYMADDAEQFSGINDRRQLTEVERLLTG